MILSACTFDTRDLWISYATIGFIRYSCLSNLAPIFCCIETKVGTAKKAKELTRFVRHSVTYQWLRMLSCVSLGADTSNPC